MAILQISRITHRKGLAENFPQLAGAELGWAIDERRLFIGNGEIVDGAPVIGNTEVLTEYSDILSLIGTYTYEGLAAGYKVDTGGGVDINRTLISKLDDFASVKDFGAAGDFITDDTDAINRALYELFCRSTVPSIRRGLYFPAGKYLITGVIKIPPNAYLFGEGELSSLLVYRTPIVDTFVGVDDETAPGVYTLSATIASGYTDSVTVNDVAETNYTIVGTTLTFTGTAPVQGDSIKVYSRAPYCITTSDNQHAIDVNIGDGVGAVLPYDIQMIRMGVESEAKNTILYVNSAENITLEDVSLHGPMLLSEITTSSTAVADDTAAVHIVSLGSTNTSNIIFNRVSTKGTTYALKAKDAMVSIKFSHCKLDTHYRGLFVERKSLISTDPDYNKFPDGVILTNSTLDNIALEGFYSDGTPKMVSSNNLYFGVGNDTSASTPVSPVVSFNNDANCVSVGDLFERTDANNEVHPRVQLPTGLGGIALDGAHSMKLGLYERTVALTAALDAPIIDDGNFVIGQEYKIINDGGGSSDFTMIGAANSLPGTVFIATGTDAGWAGPGTGTGQAYQMNYTSDIFTMTDSLANSYRVDYNISRDLDSRTGSFKVSISGATVVYEETLTETADLNVTLDVLFSGSGSNSIFRATVYGDTTANVNYSIVKLD